jgi:hypothetical protein
MSDTLHQVIERASVDASFRAQLQNNPEEALAGYTLTPEERAAVLSGDPAALSSLGVDVRVSKLEWGPGQSPLDNPAAPGAVFGQGPFGG